MSENHNDFNDLTTISSHLEYLGYEIEKQNNLRILAKHSVPTMLPCICSYFYENRNRGNRKYATVGAGFKLDFMDINLSYLIPSGAGITRNPLSNTMRLGVCFKLGE